MVAVQCSCVSNTWTRYKEDFTARYLPKKWGIYACFLLAFATGFHEYGVVSVIDAILVHVLELNSDYATPTSMMVQGVPYLLFVFPLSYWVGHRFGHKLSFLVGLVCMYLYALYGVTVCALTHCTVAGGELDGLAGESGGGGGRFPVLLPGLGLYFVSLALMYYNMVLLCLDQIPQEDSRVRNAVLHWLQVSFFAGETVAYVSVPLMFKWWGAFSGYLLVGGVSLLGLLFLMWSPMSLAKSGHRGHPFKQIGVVLLAAAKEWYAGVRTAWRKRRRGNVLSQDAFNNLPSTAQSSRLPYSMRLRSAPPNCFERVQDEYGGRLPAEEVRDVQQFCLICFMLLSFTAYHMVFSIMNIADLSQIQRMVFPDVAVSKTALAYNSGEGKSCFHNDTPATPCLNITTVSSIQFPAASLNAVHSLTSVLTLILFDRVILPLFGPYLRLRTKIAVGLLFSFASCLVAMVVEVVRTDNVKASSVINNFAEIKQGLATQWPAVPMSALLTIPHLVLFGVANAIVQIGSLELSCLASPYNLQPFSLAIYLFTFGAAQFISAAVIFSQIVPRWCFYCGREPSEGLSVYIATTVFSFLLIPLYFFLSYSYGKLEWAVHKPINTEILEDSIVARVDNGIILTASKTSSIQA